MLSITGGRKMAGELPYMSCMQGCTLGGMGNYILAMFRGSLLLEPEKRGACIAFTCQTSLMQIVLFSSFKTKITSV